MSWGEGGRTILSNTESLRINLEGDVVVARVRMLYRMVVMYHIGAGAELRNSTVDSSQTPRQEPHQNRGRVALGIVASPM